MCGYRCVCVIDGEESKSVCGRENEMCVCYKTMTAVQRERGKAFPIERWRMCSECHMRGDRGLRGNVNV